MKAEDHLLEMFVDLPTRITRWFLDTNVWGQILNSTDIINKFIDTFSNTNHLAGLTIYSLFELSRAKRLIPLFDDLFFRLRHNIWIPLLYDYVFERELNKYPDRIDIPCMPISLLTGEVEGGPNVMSNFADDSRFTSTRDEHLQFGFENFLSLEKFKKNFTQKDPTGYSSEEAYEFAKLNGLDYFRRLDRSFIRRLGTGSTSFDPRGIPSQFARSIFLFYKFYIHGQSPNRSDFMDFANISYLPYFDVYVTERNVLNTLLHIMASTEFLNKLSVQHVSDFIDRLGRH